METATKNNVQTVKFIREQMEKDGAYGSFNDKAMGYFLCGFDSIADFDYDRRNWYTNFTRVIVIEGKLISFTWAYCTGDDSIFDSWNFSSSTLAEVEPVEVTRIEYRDIVI